eukprot:maker-scaffold1678_size31397-snap-gene-0.6 protein:Tk10672 transcript:maker-scaffold1678_size31397-snap-gene-0.6-mRNA-1 annotation:"reverse transcriptase-like protein"
MASWVASKLVKEVVELVMRSIRFWMLARDAAAAATATTPAATPPKPKAKSTTIWKSSVKRKLHFDREKVPAHRSNTLEGILLRMGNDALDLMEIRDRAPPGKEYRRLRNQVSSMVKRDKLRTNLDKLRKSHNDPKVLWGLANAALGKPPNASLPTSLLVNGIATVGSDETAQAMNHFFIDKVDKLRQNLAHVSAPSSDWPASSKPFSFSFASAAIANAQAQWLKGSQGGNVVGVLAFDLSSAFDTVDKAQLIPKLAALGIKGTALSWFDSCLSGGRQCVDWSGTRPSFADVTFGVRQGSIIGPCLFLVLMADLPDCLGIGEECNVGYADDVSIWAVGKDLPTVKSLLDQRAESFARFAAGNGLIMNASKTQLMLGGKVRRADLEDFHVVVDGVTVFPDKKLELLGVKFDSSFSTFPHGASVSASARQRAAMIARLSHHLPRGAYLQQLARGLVLDWSGTRSSFADVTFGVRQGSILGPCLILVLMADLPDCLRIREECNVGYADDVSIWAVGKDLPTVKSLLDQRAESFARFAAGNGLIMNASKTQLMLGGKVRRADLEDFHVVVDGVTVFPDKKLELLGVKFDSSFSTFPHGASVSASARQRAAMIARLSHHLPRGAYLQQLARGLVLDEANTISQRQGEYYSSHPVRGGGGGGILDGPIPLLAALAIGGALAAFFIFQQATEARNNLENQLNVVNNSVNMAETDINALIASVNTAQTNANTNLNEATILCSANEAAGALPAADMAMIVMSIDMFSAIFAGLPCP